MSKHTPGPWNVRNDGNQYCGAVIDSPSVGNGYYASLAHAHQRDPHPIHGGGVSQQEAEANARLIAAAPEMLEALQSFLRAPSVGSSGTGSITIVVQDFNMRAARVAIAKATGETK